MIRPYGDFETLASCGSKQITSGESKAIFKIWKERVVEFVVEVWPYLKGYFFTIIVMMIWPGLLFIVNRDETNMTKVVLVSYPVIVVYISSIFLTIFSLSFIWFFTFNPTETWDISMAVTKFLTWSYLVIINAINIAYWRITKSSCSDRYKDEILPVNTGVLISIMLISLFILIPMQIFI